MKVKNRPASTVATSAEDIDGLRDERNRLIGHDPTRAAMKRLAAGRMARSGVGGARSPGSPNGAAVYGYDPASDRYRTDDGLKRMANWGTPKFGRRAMKFGDTFVAEPAGEPFPPKPKKPEETEEEIEIAVTIGFSGKALG